MDFWTELDAVRARNDVLAHPFYQRWSAGELTRGELAVYAGEYRHAVRALAQGAAGAAAVADEAARDDVVAHAREEAGHVALWDAFARAVGADIEREPAPETAACVRAWTGDPGRSLLRSLVALYAIEAAQPDVAATKLAGLREHYGLADGPATEYFTLHAELDREHAAQQRRLIDQRLDGADRDELLAEARRVLHANWQLLDGVERLNDGG